MTQANIGNTVKVHYTGKLEDGTEFDSSTNQAPLQFTIGEGRLIPGFEQALVGMSPGETKTATISADQAYGPHDEDLVLIVDRDQVPQDLNPQVGQHLEIRQQDERIIDVRVTQISKSSVTLDANHPLAGKELTFDINLVEII